MANTSVLKAILDELDTSWATITTGNGYEFTMGTIDEFDFSSKTYPDTEKIFPETDGDETVLERYSAETVIHLKTTIATSADLDNDLLRVDSDIGLMFNTRFSNLQTAGLTDYEYLGHEIGYTLVSAYPAFIITKWLFKHRRQMSDPYST